MSKKNLLDAWQVFLKRSYIIIVCALLLGGAGYLWSKHIYHVQYKAESSIMVFHENGEKRQTDIASVPTYEKLIENKIILSKVQKQMQHVKGYDMTLDELKAAVSAKSKPGTFIITVKTNAESAKMAARITNTVIDVFKTNAEKLASAGTVKQMAKADSKDATLNSANSKKYALLGFMIGIAAGVVIIVVIDHKKFLNYK